MKIALALAVLLSAPSPQDVTYDNPELGFSMKHPATWQVSTKKGDSRILIPIADSKEHAILEIFSALYRSDPEIWQTTQLRVNEQLKRTVHRQWQEEFMGVPLLLTKISYEDRGEPKVALIGLLYTATPRKMNFRLTSAAGVYDTVEYEVRSALQTLRTIDGSLPTAENPNRTVDTAQTTRPPVITRIDGGPLPPKEIHKGEVAVEATAAGRPVVLRMPAPWGAVADGEWFVLRHPDLKGALRVDVASVLDSDPAIRGLFKASTGSLDLFEKVARRDENRPVQNRAGAQTSAIWRTGASSTGPLTTCDAAGWLGDFYWLLEYRLAGEAGPEDRKLVEALIDGMSVEPS
jgi:hypothetical protein